MSQCYERQRHGDGGHLCCSHAVGDHTVCCWCGSQTSACDVDRDHGTHAPTEAPAWTPGPPTEPGRWELTWRSREDVVEVFVGRVVFGLLDVLRLHLDGGDGRGRILADVAPCILAHRPYNPEPWRP